MVIGTWLDLHNLATVVLSIVLAFVFVCADRPGRAPVGARPAHRA
ncbi:MAG: hypothetical protein ABJA74_01810 [Lapillicoccus sp.]